jgi:hypothetical protein
MSLKKELEYAQDELLKVLAEAAKSSAQQIVIIRQEMLKLVDVLEEMEKRISAIEDQYMR